MLDVIYALRLHYLWEGFFLALHAEVQSFSLKIDIHLCNQWNGY